MRILITGGAGYIGSHCARFLRARGHEPIAIDDLSTGHPTSLDGLPLTRLDLCTDDIAAFLRNSRVESVMHFAAKCLVPESVAHPARYYRTNMLGGVRLLDAMVDAGVKRIVMSSTCATYGLPVRTPLGGQGGGSPPAIAETHPQTPITSYGRTKLAMEHALDDYARAYGIGAVALRYFNAAGAEMDGSFGEDHAPETHLIPNVLFAARGGPPIQVCGTDYPTPDGTCIRDYVHLDDLARAHLVALEGIQDGRLRAFNIATGVGSSVREVIDCAAKVTGKKIPTVDAPRRPGDPAALVADPRKAREELGYVTERTLEDIVRSAWLWHQRRPTGYGAH